MSPPPVCSECGADLVEDGEAEAEMCSCCIDVDPTEGEAR